MSNLVLNATRIARHSRRYYQYLCGWCDGELGVVGAAHAGCSCDQGRELLRAARQRIESLGSFPPEPLAARPGRQRRSPRRCVRVRGPALVRS